MRRVENDPIDYLYAADAENVIPGDLHRVCERSRRDRAPRVVLDREGFELRVTWRDDHWTLERLEAAPSPARLSCRGGSP